MWWLRGAQDFVRSLVKSNTQGNLSADQIGRLRICLPPLDEQRAIAAFLDRETERIDALVTKKQALIERLQEYRTALITRTVTRGLPPEAARAAGLDPNPSLKPSGVEWLGDIPEHWEVRRLEHSVRRAGNKLEAEDVGDLPYVGLEHVESWTGRLSRLDSNVTPEGDSREFAAGDVLFGKLRPYLAKAFCPKFDGVCSSEFLVLKPTSFWRGYLLFLLLSNGLVSLVNSSTYGAKMPRANWEFVGGVLLPLPPFDEQRAIADYLDEETARLDELTTLVELAIERLQEYRTALITAAVTGKIDVRDAGSFNSMPGE